MFRSIVFGIFLITAATAAVVPEASNIPNNLAVQVLVVDDISKLKDLKQGVELIPLNSVQEKTQIRYTLGNRVSNDRLVSQLSDYYQWAVPQNVQLRIQYPASGTGAIISYVDILVDQSSSSGQAYVVSGGIGQRYIVIIVEAYNTYWFNYVSRIYGV